MDDSPNFICPKKYSAWLYGAVWIYALALIFLNFIRIFDNVFWIDEAYYAIWHAALPWGKLIHVLTHEDIQQPFYYLLLKCFMLFLGRHGWVYHLTSLAPCLILVPFSLTLFRKHFGLPAALILATYIGLSPAAVHYNVEVRMYSWAMLWMCMAFYGFYLVSCNFRSGWQLFVCGAILAGYTHIYCLPAIGLLFLLLLIFCRKKHCIGSWALAAFCCLTASAPWLYFFIGRSLTYAKESWQTWAMAPNLFEAANYIFTGGLAFPWYWHIGLLLTILVLFALARGVWQFSQGGMTQKDFTTLWLLTAGVICAVGTWAAGYTISWLLKPLLIKRYLFPVSIMGWISVALAPGFFRRGRIISMFLLAVLLVCFAPEYWRIYQKESMIAERCDQTLAILGKVIKPEDALLTFGVNAHLYYTSHYYFPDNKIISHDKYNAKNPYSDMRIDNLSPDITYYILATSTWLEDGEPLDIEKLRANLAKEGFDCVEIVKDGYIGDYKTDVYKVFHGQKLKKQNDR